MLNAKQALGVDTSDLSIANKIDSLLRIAPLDPCTRLQVAVHESGHVVVGQATRVVCINSVRVFVDCDPNDNRKVWGGFVRRDEIECTYVVDDPATFANLALYGIAGVVGEHVANLHNPNSLKDEHIQFVKRAEQLGEVWTLDAQTIVRSGLTVAASIIHTNSEVFDALRWRLLKKRVIKGTELKSFLDLIKPVDGYGLWLTELSWLRNQVDTADPILGESPTGLGQPFLIKIDL